jgi:hypothetical protein
VDAPVVLNKKPRKLKSPAYMGAVQHANASISAHHSSIRINIWDIMGLYRNIYNIGIQLYT